MKGKTNTIIINGRVYNTATGMPVDGHIVKPSSHTTKKIVQKKSPANHTVHKITVSDDSTSTVTPVRKSDSSRRPQATNRKPERTQTLMRHLVKKPSRGTSTRHAVSTSLDNASHGTKIIIHKGSSSISAPNTNVTNISTRSSRISRFTSTSNVTKRTAHVPVTTPPKHIQVSTQTTTKPTAKHRSHNYNIAQTPPAPIIIPDNQPLRSLHRDLFETAMQSSHSHEIPRHKKAHSKHRRAARFTLAASSLLLLVAFFAYQNAPNLALKRASSTIGFTASIPTYRPSGFRMAGGVQYQPGKVVVSFRSNSDTRAYNITQVTSNITDDTLQQRFLKGQSYEQVTTNGQVAYLYGADNFTWLRNGIWYTIDGDSGLSKDQLVRVASSLF